jgi:predicted phage terminase large subunit-like protein
MVLLRVEIAVLRHQLDYAGSSARRVGLIAGRGAGKTWAGAYRLLLCAARDFGQYAVVAPTYTMLEDIDWPAVRSVARLMRIDLVESPGKMLMAIPGRSEIRFRSADRPDRLRGLNLSGCWLDEAAQIEEEVLRVLMPALRLGPIPWLAVTTTPKGTGHWTYQMFGPQAIDAHVIRARTADNPLLSATVRGQLYGDLVGVWARQELDAEWVDPEGTEWGAEHWGDWVMVQSIPLDRCTRRVIAVDPSLGAKPDSGDYSAIVALGWCDGLLWVEADLARRPPHVLIADVLQMADRWKPHAVGIEAVAFQQVLIGELVRQRRVPWPVYGIKAEGAKSLRIRRLGPAITRREIRIADTQGGRLLYRQLRDWPMSDHDDGPDALEMALRLIMEMTA